MSAELERIYNRMQATATKDPQGFAVAAFDAIAAAFEVQERYGKLLQRISDAIIEYSGSGLSSSQLKRQGSIQLNEQPAPATTGKGCDTGHCSGFCSAEGCGSEIDPTGVSR